MHTQRERPDSARVIEREGLETKHRLIGVSSGVSSETLQQQKTKNAGYEGLKVILTLSCMLNEYA